MMAALCSLFRQSPSLYSGRALLSIQTELFSRLTALVSKLRQMSGEASATSELCLNREQPLSSLAGTPQRAIKAELFSRLSSLVGCLRSLSQALLSALLRQSCALY
jgi:hypothetical protein